MWIKKILSGSMKYIFANWKMYLDYEESLQLAEELSSFPFDTNKIEVALFPNDLLVAQMSVLLGNSPFAIGAQDFSTHPEGAYTGETSIDMYKSLSCHYALVGHSERRKYVGESNEIIHRKIELALDKGIDFVLCIGESEEVYLAGETKPFLKKQIEEALDGLNLEGKNIFIAYEPIWAIGTGHASNPEYAVEIAEFIRGLVYKFAPKALNLLYGGSVNDQNVLSYIVGGAFDGVLIGHSSTEKDEFEKIIRDVESL